MVQYGGCGVVPEETVIKNLLWMLFCASRGDEIEGWKEKRGEKMHEVKDS